MGHGSHNGGPVIYHGFQGNVLKLKESYDFSQGYFGVRGDGGSSFVRHIESDDPLSAAHVFYDKAAYGGLEEKLGPGRWKTTMEDGTVLTMREVSSSDGSPAVDINIRRSTDVGDVKNQRIHFVKKRQGD